MRVIGSGGMGQVLEGVHEQLGRRAAIKILHPQLAQDIDMEARFFNEARAVTLIQHPGIVAVYDFGMLEDGGSYIVMEYLDGVSLRERIDQRGRLGIEGVRIARQIASALTAAHDKGVVHRDLKPRNIMLVPEADISDGERVKVVDFGIAKLPSRDAGARAVKTLTGVILGTPTYMSPEQCGRGGEVGEKSDVYSLGIIMYEMLAGRPPFVGSDAIELLGMHLFMAPPSLAEVLPPEGQSLAALVGRMLAKVPADRPTMREVTHELSQTISRLSGEAAHVVPAYHLPSSGYFFSKTSDTITAVSPSTDASTSASTSASPGADVTESIDQGPSTLQQAHAQLQPRPFSYSSLYWGVVGFVVTMLLVGGGVLLSLRRSHRTAARTPPIAALPQKPSASPPAPVSTPPPAAPQPAPQENQARPEPPAPPAAAAPTTAQAEAAAPAPPAPRLKPRPPKSSRSAPAREPLLMTEPPKVRIELKPAPAPVPALTPEVPKIVD